MSKKHKRLFRVLSYIEQSLILVSKFNGCVTTSVFASLVVIPLGIVSSAAGLKIYVI